MTAGGCCGLQGVLWQFGLPGPSTSSRWHGIENKGEARIASGVSPLKQNPPGIYATMAQSVEHIHGKDGVISSILIGSSIYLYAIGEKDITYGYGP